MFDPMLVALHDSRGYESYASKQLMRWTVVASDVLCERPARPAGRHIAARRCAVTLRRGAAPWLPHAAAAPPRPAPRPAPPSRLSSAPPAPPARPPAVFFPAALACVLVFARGAGRPQQLFLLAALALQPAALLIDHAHFQYNGISLGLSAAAAAAIGAGHHVAGSVLYCLALNHKQMALFYAPAFFAHLLGRCLQAKGAAAKVGAGSRRGAAPGRAVLLQGRRCVLWRQRSGGAAWPWRAPSAAAAALLLLLQVLGVAKLGVTVVATFAACWAPWLGSLEATLQVRAARCRAPGAAARARARAAPLSDAAASSAPASPRCERPAMPHPALAPPRRCWRASSPWAAACTRTTWPTSGARGRAWLLLLLLLLLLAAGC